MSFQATEDSEVIAIVPNASDRSWRISRTTQQAGVGTALALIIVWVSALLPWDLDPTDPTSTTMPPSIAAAIVFVGTVAAAAWMNRKKKNDPATLHTEGELHAPLPPTPPSH